MQVLRGIWWRGGKRKENLQPHLEFEYLHWKSRCKMLIGRDDVSNDIITFGTCFSMFVYICARFCLALIGGNLTAQLMGNHRGIGEGIQIPETYLQALLPFAAPLPECTWELAHRLAPFKYFEANSIYYNDLKCSFKNTVHAKRISISTAKVCFEELFLFKL